MLHHPPVADPAAYADARELISSFGQYAAMEAESRARKSRDQGNVLQFCRWRQAARTVAIVCGDEPEGSIH